MEVKAFLLNYVRFILRNIRRVSLTPHPSACTPGFFDSSTFQITILQNSRGIAIFFVISGYLGYLHWYCRSCTAI